MGVRELRAMHISNTLHHNPNVAVRVLFPATIHSRTDAGGRHQQQGHEELEQLEHDGRVDPVQTFGKGEE